MKYILYLFALAVCAFASLVLYVAWNQTHNAIHEIAAFILYGVGAVFLVGGAIVESMGAKQPEAKPPRGRSTRTHRYDPRLDDAARALEEMQ